MAKFPKDLAALVVDRWDKMIGGEYICPPCPPKAVLKNVLESSYLAAAAPEEARYPKFNLVVTPQAALDSPLAGFTADKFKTPRPLNVAEIRRLAPATDIKKSAIWVVWEDNKAQIAGLCDLGTSWHRARMALSYGYQVPSALIVQIDRPGRIKVYQGAYAVASLFDGVLAAATFDLHGFLHPAVSGGLASLGSKFTEPEIEEPRDYHNFWFTALWNVFASIANSISASEHGGMVIIARNAETFSEKVRIKYQTDSTSLQDSFVTFINARNKTADFWEKAEREKSQLDPAGHQAEIVLFNATERLVESIRFIAQLAGCDGAIVISEDLRLIGFGAEIRAELHPEKNVSEVTFEYGGPGVSCDIEQFGMRHRSAIKLVSQAAETCVLVISQDGPVSGVWTKNGDVLLKKGISLTNLNMPLA